MIGTILAVTGVVGSVIPWLLDTSDKIDATKDMNRQLAVRTLTGHLALQNGPTENIDVESAYVEVPPDPAFGGQSVLMTHTEAVWWMSAGSVPGSSSLRASPKKGRARLQS